MKKMYGWSIGKSRFITVYLYFNIVNISMNISMINMTSSSSQVVSMTMTPDHTGECCGLFCIIVIALRCVV
jgi:hypothetical protein